MIYLVVLHQICLSAFWRHWFHLILFSCTHPITIWLLFFFSFSFFSRLFLFVCFLVVPYISTWSVPIFSSAPVIMQFRTSVEVSYHPISSFMSFLIVLFSFLKSYFPVLADSLCHDFFDIIRHPQPSFTNFNVWEFTELNGRNCCATFIHSLSLVGFCLASLLCHFVLLLMVNLYRPMESSEEWGWMMLFSFPIGLHTV